MNKDELGALLFGNNRLEGNAKMSTTSTITGTAQGTSANGKVLVKLSDNVTSSEDGDGTEETTQEMTGSTSVELDTEVHVEEGDSVSIGLVGGNIKSPRVTGVVGGGDRMQAQVENAETLAGQAEEVARRTNEHFWDDGQGAHVTEYEQDLFTDPTKEEYQSGANVLINSIGQLFRDGLTNLLALLPAQKTTETFTGDGSTTSFTLSVEPNVARPMKVTVDNEPTADYTTNGTALTFSTAPSDGAVIVVEYRAKSAVSALAVYDGMGNDSENITASFSSSGATIGKEAGAHIDITPSGMTLYDYWGADAVDIGSMSPTGQVVAQSVTFTPTSLGKAVVTLTDRYANTPVLVTVRRGNETKRASLTDNGSATLDFTDGSCLVTLYNTQLVVSGSWSSGTAEFSTGDTTPYIALGNSSKNTLIDFCDGEGRLSYDSTLSKMTFASNNFEFTATDDDAATVNLYIARTDEGGEESVPHVAGDGYASIAAISEIEDINYPRRYAATMEVECNNYASEGELGEEGAAKIELRTTGLGSTTAEHSPLSADIYARATGTVNISSGGNTTIATTGGTTTFKGNGDIQATGDVLTSGTVASSADNGIITNNPNVTNGTAPSSDTWGVTHHSLRDKNGSILGYLRTPFMADGRQGLQLEQIRNVNGSDVYNGIQLFIDASGNRTVNLSSPSAWLAALGLNQPLIATRKQTVTVAANEIVLRNIAAPSVSGYTFSHWLQPSSSGHVTNAYMADPTAQTTNLWVPGNATSSTRSFVVTAVYYLTTQ